MLESCFIDLECVIQGRFVQLLQLCFVCGYVYVCSWVVKCPVSIHIMSGFRDKHISSLWLLFFLVFKTKQSGDESAFSCG